jgi:hypothetical protein
MTRDLGRRIRKLESSLPPLLTDDVSRMAGLLWFAIAHYLGDPSPDERPFAAYARALGYADESELNRALAFKYREVWNRVSSAEHKVCTKFGIDVPSLEYSDSDGAKLCSALDRMKAGLPRAYKDQLEVVSTRVDNLACIRLRSVAEYLRCFA